MKTTDKIIIIDLEATCWQGAQPKDQISEIIEIGICVLDIHTHKISGNKGILIKSTKSEVSKFCTELTTITQDLLDREGITFKEACDLIRTEYDGHQYTWASYGAYDLKMFTNQCKMRNIDYPLSHNHINVKEYFADLKNSGKKVGMNGALHILNIPLEGVHHRGVDDAKNIAKILSWYLKNNQNG